MLDVYRRGRPGASPTDLFVAITTGQWMWHSAIVMAERKAALKAAPVYMYQFAYESEVPVAPGRGVPEKAAHAMEIAFKFNHPETSPEAGKRPERFTAARNMSAAWAAFARTGNPSHPRSRPGRPTTRSAARRCGSTRSAASSTTRSPRSGSCGTTSAGASPAGRKCRPLALGIISV